MDAEKIHWRKHLNDDKCPVDFKTFYEAASAGLKEKIVRNMFYLKPFKMPKILE